MKLQSKSRDDGDEHDHKLDEEGLSRDEKKQQEKDYKQIGDEDILEAIARLEMSVKDYKAEKKWDATFVYPDGHQKVVPFGAAGMSDYTKHKDKTRKLRYLKRHSGMGESWQKPDTPGALAKWVLWNKKTLRASIADYKKRFKLG
jgi:hypothetical protein